MRITGYAVCRFSCGISDAVFEIDGVSRLGPVVFLCGVLSVVELAGKCGRGSCKTVVRVFVGKGAVMKKQRVGMFACLSVLIYRYFENTVIVSARTV